MSMRDAGDGRDDLLDLINVLCVCHYGICETGYLGWKTIFGGYTSVLTIFVEVGDDLRVAGEEEFVESKDDLPLVDAENGDSGFDNFDGGGGESWGGCHGEIGIEVAVRVVRVVCV